MVLRFPYPYNTSLSRAVTNRLGGNTISLMNKPPSSLVLEPHQREQEKEFVLPSEEQTVWTQCIAEGIGTFGLVFAGCGAIMIDRLSGGQITHVGVGLVFGLIITVMIYALGHISGAHFNPAVTLGFVLARHFPLRRLVGYWTAQVAGATLAAATLRLLLGDVAHLGATTPAGSGGAWQSFGLEALLTFFLMF